MDRRLTRGAIALSMGWCLIAGGPAGAAEDGTGRHDLFTPHDTPQARHHRREHTEDGAQIQVGARPYYLVDDMDEGRLKRRLELCAGGPFHRTDFSIGHRGAPLRFPEHTRESYLAAARMGAGILECDVTFTSDGELVCRHAQCDLHATTNILATDLAETCRVPFRPASPAEDAEALCCTSEITLEQFKSLKGRRHGFNPKATTVEEYLAGTPPRPADRHAAEGTLLSHAESIALFKGLGTKFTPELKGGFAEDIVRVFGGQEAYARKMIDEYRMAGVRPDEVRAQSFNLADVLYWIDNEPAFGEQAVYLDGRYDDPDFDHTDPDTWEPGMAELVDAGVRILAPPLWMLVRTDEGEIVPSTYAMHARQAGLNLITWTLERSGSLAGGGGWYYQSVSDVIDNDGDTMTVLDVLARDVGVIGVFSDWPGTVTYYANCMGLE